jgi:hypothetical protein
VGAVSAPPDRRTRGRTRAGRLAALDAWLLATERPLLEAPGAAPVVDVGFGAEPWTLLEFAAATRSAQPSLAVVGVERDGAALRAAERPCAEHGVTLSQGGFQLDAIAPARLVRAMNVLRGYTEAEAAQAHALLGEALAEGGLLVEGSASEDGALCTTHLLRKVNGALRHEALWFATDFTRGFAPIQFRDWLPRDLRRAVKPGTAIHGLLQRWTAAWEGVRGGRPPREAFTASLDVLATTGEPLRRDASLPGQVAWLAPVTPARPHGG